MTYSSLASWTIGPLPFNSRRFIYSHYSIDVVSLSSAERRV